MKRAKLTRMQINAVAAAASCDWRSVTKVLAGGKIRGPSDARIRASLSAVGIPVKLRLI